MLFLLLNTFADMLVELSRREKAANIRPDPDIDVFMKVYCLTLRTIFLAYTSPLQAFGFFFV